MKNKRNRLEFYRIQPRIAIIHICVDFKSKMYLINKYINIYVQKSIKTIIIIILI